MQCIFLSLLICFKRFIQLDLYLPRGPSDSGYHPAVVSMKLSLWAPWSAAPMNFLLLDITQYFVPSP